METARGIIEIGLFAAAIYLVLRFLRETRGSGVIRGLTIIFILATVFSIVIIELLQLARLRMVFDALANTTVLALIIVFHPEIRRAIVHLGDSPMFGRFLKREIKVLQRVLRAVARLQKEKIGALIAFEREGSLAPYVEKGTRIDADVNSYLIESIFYPGGALHDGAVVIQNDRIAAASCLFPLSENAEISKRLGTRHRAAVGLTEETDAFTIVVSEETGKVSVGLNGHLHHDLSLQELEAMMVTSLSRRKEASAAGRSKARKGVRPFLKLFREDAWRKLASLGLAFALWVSLAQRATENFNTNFDLMTSPVARGQEAPPGKIGLRFRGDNYVITDYVLPGDDHVQVKQVTVTFSGPKNLIDRVPGIGLTVNVEEREVATGVAEVSADRLLASLHELTSVVSRMEPPRVNARIALMGSATFTVTREQVTELKWPEDKSVEERIIWAEAELPAQATLVGPKKELEQLPKGSAASLFQVNLTGAQSPGALFRGAGERSYFKARIALRDDLAAKKIELKETLEAKVPLRRTANVIQIMLTPEFDYPPDSGTNGTDQWVQPKPEKVTIRSFNPDLDRALDSKEWVKNQCRLKVNMAGKTPDDLNPPSRFFCYSDQFREGEDYRVEALDPIVLVKK